MQTLRNECSKRFAFVLENLMLILTVLFDEPSLAFKIEFVLTECIGFRSSPQ
jgi:hypothetical protein